MLLAIRLPTGEAVRHSIGCYRDIGQARPESRPFISASTASSPLPTMNWNREVEFEQPDESFTGHGTGNHVSADNDPVRTGTRYIFQDRLQCREIAVNIIKRCDRHESRCRRTEVRDQDERSRRDVPP